MRLKTLNLIKFFWFWLKKSANPRNTNKLQIFITKYTNDRSSHQRCSAKKGVLRNFAKFTGKHLCQRLLFNKVAGLRRKWWIPKSEKLQIWKNLYDQQNLLPEAVVRRCSVKKVFLQISQNPQENTCARVSFLIKLKAEACNFVKKETLRTSFLQNTFRKLLIVFRSSWVIFNSGKYYTRK